MIEITPESLKAEAERALMEKGIDDTVLSGKQRQLTVLMMSSFACQIAARELAAWVAEEAA